jgi:hypothetical protein
VGADIHRCVASVAPGNLATNRITAQRPITQPATLRVCTVMA